MVLTRSQRKDVVHDQTLVIMQEKRTEITKKKITVTSVAVKSSKKRKRKQIIRFSKQDDLTCLPMSTFIWSNPVDGKKMKDADVRLKRRKIYNQRKQVEYKDNRRKRLENEENWRKLVPTDLSLEDADAEAKFIENGTMTKPKTDLGPEMEVNENGEFIIKETSLYQKNESCKDDIETFAEVGEEITYITSASYSRKKRKGRAWTGKETERFYKALRSVGQDFGLISQMFPNRIRREIKAKFKREEKLRPNHIKLALHSRAVLPIDLEMLSYNTEKKVRKSLKKLGKLKSLDDLYEEQQIEHKIETTVLPRIQDVKTEKETKDLKKEKSRSTISEVIEVDMKKEKNENKDNDFSLDDFEQMDEEMDKFDIEGLAEEEEQEEEEARLQALLNTGNSDSDDEDEDDDSDF